MRFRLAISLVPVALLTSVSGTDAQEQKPILREQRWITVDAVGERWRLEWRAPPTPVCRPDPGNDNWQSCPCAGFAYGERGLLDLVRTRSGHADERLPLTPFFGDGLQNPATIEGVAEAVLMKWPARATDSTIADSPHFEQRVRARAVSSAMQMVDFDHDGRATEFGLQVGAFPCFHAQAVVVGISRSIPSLHVFSSVAHPERPLVLSPGAWSALVRARGHVDHLDWPCGDHGAGDETHIELDFDDRGIRAARATYACTDDDKRGALLSREEF